MNVLLLAPHADDETLFASYICQRERPFIVCCFNQDRGDEFTRAIASLVCNGAMIGLPGFRADATELIRHLSAVYPPEKFDKVWAPAIEEYGHEDHNLVGEVALHVYGDLVHSYLTYAPRGQRSTWGVEVPDVRAWEIASKFRALAHYLSQIEDPATRPWFTSLLDMREWTK